MSVRKIQTVANFAHGHAQGRLTQHHGIVREQLLANRTERDRIRAECLPGPIVSTADVAEVEPLDLVTKTLESLMADNKTEFSELDVVFEGARKTPDEVQAMLDEFLLGEEDAEDVSSEGSKYADNSEVSAVDKAFEELLAS